MLLLLYDLAPPRSLLLDQKTTMALLKKKAVEGVLRPLLPSWRSAFAYGSGVFPQSDQKERRMLDVLIVVDDPVAWHRENLRRNRDHYSGLAIHPRIVTGLGNLGPGVYFNTAVSVDSEEWSSLKYGVASSKKFENDLRNWNHLYLAGRLHKPTLRLDDDSTFDEALSLNRRAAVAAALARLPEEFTAPQLFAAISGLSYHGDTRFLFGGEDPQKIDNIVRHNLTHFIDLYDETAQQILCKPLTSQIFSQKHVHLDQHLPKPLRGCSKDELSRRLRRRVARSSIIQTLKGILTAGPQKAVAYVKAKFDKAKQSSLTETTNHIGGNGGKGHDR